VKKRTAIPIKIMGKNKSSEIDLLVSESQKKMKKMGRPKTDNNRIEMAINNSLKMIFPIIKNRNKNGLYKVIYSNSRWLI
jgi:hypothetical protein